jgi:hypothetical protein
MLRDGVANGALEEKWRFLILGVQLTIDKNTAVQVPLCIIAKYFVFCHDACIHVVDELEIGIGGVPVFVDLI